MFYPNAKIPSQPLLTNNISFDTRRLEVDKSPENIQNPITMKAISPALGSILSTTGTEQS